MVNIPISRSISLVPFFTWALGVYPSYIYPMESWPSRKIKRMLVVGPFLDEKLLRMHAGRGRRRQQAVNGCEIKLVWLDQWPGLRTWMCIHHRIHVTWSTRALGCRLARNVLVEEPPITGKVRTHRSPIALGTELDHNRLRGPNLPASLTSHKNVRSYSIA